MNKGTKEQKSSKWVHHNQVSWSSSISPHDELKRLHGVKGKLKQAGLVIDLSVWEALRSLAT